MNTRIRFTDRQVKDFAAYEEVRSSGRVNMFDPSARILAGLDRNEHIFVMKNFEGLQAQYREENT